MRPLAQLSKAWFLLLLPRSLSGVSLLVVRTEYGNIVPTKTIYI